jgi:uncharacterized membrane protein YphA (DoxX/SURF4 family)
MAAPATSDTANTMTIPLTGLLLILFGAALLLVTLSIFFQRGATSAEDDRTSNFAKFFLVALRLAIGWHLLIEGVEKLQTPTWTSEGYLREATGPLGPVFRGIAGDRVAERLSVTEAKEPSALFLREWSAYTTAFASHHQLAGETQLKKFDEAREKEKDKFVTWVTTISSEVVKPSPYPPPLKVAMTAKERVDYLDVLQKKVAEAEAKFPSDDPDVLKKWRDAKADAGKWRADLKRSYDTQLEAMKKSLQSVLDDEQKKQAPLAEPVRLPMTQWGMLEWSDFKVKWALVILGGGLIVGLFSRVCSFASALLVLSFFAAMPPLPGYPESPRLEGHYLLINKTLIEVIALFALAFIPTGRWGGLDGLIRLMCCSTPKAASESAKSQQQQQQPVAT